MKRERLFELKEIINAKIKDFADNNIYDAGLELFENLGYNTVKRYDIDSNDPDDLLAEIDEDNELNKVKAKFNKWISAAILFQLTEDELSSQLSILSDDKYDPSKYLSYLFLAIELEDEKYTRTELSDITREVNKLFGMPVMIVFKYGNYLTLSIIHRRPNKREEGRFVLEKVTTIKDINIVSPTHAQILILLDLHTEKLFEEKEPTDFLELHNAWQKVLDTTELNKRFYKEVANWYFWAKDIVEFPDGAEKDREIRNATSVIRLLTRVIFIYFMKEKGLIPFELFERNQVSKYLKDISDKESSYYKAILQNLFFATLNTPIEDRKFRDNNPPPNNHYGVFNYFRYESHFSDPQVIINLLKITPFLNGGLFECLDNVEDNNNKIRVDGFSDVTKNQPTVPNYLFFLDNFEEIDLNEIYGTKNKKYQVRGLIELLNSYKFTIAENTPLEQEIALDPEMLGKVFENLLASYNPETQTTARKMTGSFYTPREIVNYMVDESLIAYLNQKLSVSSHELNVVNKIEEKLRVLVDYNNPENPFSEDDTYTQMIIESIDEVKVLDPACGSGAFPMGILHKMVFVLYKLDPQNEKWKQQQISKAEEIQVDTAREQAIKDIEEAFEYNELDYARKLYLFEKCIYGVDIQPIAVQIAKLRFFISLLVDQTIDHNRNNLGILSLPNLETKFVSANTLIPIEKEAENLFTNKEVVNKENELKNLRKKYFAARTRQQKLKYRKKDEELRNEIVELLKKDAILQPETAKKVANWNPYNQNYSADFFDYEWMFGLNQGFDIVIGNPPYIQLQKAFDDVNKYADLYNDYKFETFERTGDIYALFYERGLLILKENGYLTFITSNKWMRSTYGGSLRSFFLKYNPKILIDLGPAIFNAAIVDTNILIINNKLSQKLNLLALTISEKDQISNMNNIKFIKVTELSQKSWIIFNKDEQKLINKALKLGTSLQYWDIIIYRGILTGLNDAFFISNELKDQLINKNSKCKEILKPIYRGRDIKKYIAKFADLWFIATLPSLKLNIDDYPGVKKHLEQFLPQIKQTGETLFDSRGNIIKTRKKTSNKWFEIQDTIAYYREFEKEKIAWKAVGRNLTFSLLKSGEYVTAPAAFLTSVHNKYLLAFLQSKFTFYFVLNNSDSTGAGDVMLNVQSIKRIPVPEISNDIENIFNSIIDTIFSKKSIGEITEYEELKVNYMIYKLFNFSYEEALIIDEEFKISKDEYDNFYPEFLQMLKEFRIKNVKNLEKEKLKDLKNLDTKKL